MRVPSEQRVEILTILGAGRQDIVLPERQPLEHIVRPEHLGCVRATVWAIGIGGAKEARNRIVSM